jgi:hypothetical protein
MSHLRELDQRLAGELQKRKIANEMMTIKTKMAIENSAEIKHMRQMIQQAYLNKDRAAQVAEQQTRSLVEKTEEALIDRAMLEKREDELGIVQNQNRMKTEALLRQKQVIFGQMAEKEDKCNEAREAFFMEKDQVNAIIQSIIDEDQQKLEKDGVKKKIAFATMQDALAEKEQMKLSVKERERLENLAYKKYLDSLEQREYEFKYKIFQFPNKKLILDCKKPN